MKIYPGTSLFALIAAGSLAGCSAPEDSATGAANEASEAGETASQPDEADGSTDAPGAAEGQMTGDEAALWDENYGYEDDPSETPPPATPEPGIGSGDATISAAARGRWGLVSRDCTANDGSEKGLLTISPTQLDFYESRGSLVRIVERSDTRIVGDYTFVGEGQEWDRRVILHVQDDGEVLIRREYGEGAAPGPFRYIRCAV